MAWLVEWLNRNPNWQLDDKFFSRISFKIHLSTSFSKSLLRHGSSKLFRQLLNRIHSKFIATTGSLRMTAFWNCIRFGRFLFFSLLIISFSFLDDVKCGQAGWDEEDVDQTQLLVA